MKPDWAWEHLSGDARARLLEDLPTLTLRHDDAPLVINTTRLDEELAEVRAIDEEKRTVDLSFSSSAPYMRWFGFEVLGHKRSEVRLQRLKTKAPLLVNHDTDRQVGVIESVRLDGEKGHAVVRFGESAYAEEIFRDVVKGIRGLTSVGYRVHKMKLEEDNGGEAPDVYRVTDWEPHEISIVPVPADITTGVGRADDWPRFEQLPPPRTHEDPDMGDENKDGGGQPATPVQVVPGVDHEAERAAVRAAETARIQSITALGNAMGLSELAQKAIADGMSSDDFMRAAAAEGVADSARPRATDIGLTDREVRSFRITRLALAMAFPSDRAVQEAAAFELEASRAATVLQAKTGAKVRGQVVPNDPYIVPESAIEGVRTIPGEVAAAPWPVTPAHAQAIARHMSGRRDLSAGGSTAGAELVATDLLASNFIDVLRNRNMLMRAGAFPLTDLVGDVAIPRKTAGGAGAWIATEGGNAGNNEPAFDQVTLTPKTAGNYVDYTRQLLMQSSLDVEMMVRADIAAGISTTIDLGGLYGSGSSGQPTGIANTTGINDPAAWAAADPTWAEVVNLETMVATDNADVGALAYMTDAAMRGAFKTTEKASSTAQFIWEMGNTVNGYPCHVTNQVTDGDLFFGNWAELIIALWGGLDILVDPYTGSIAGTVRVVGHQSADVGVRHPVSFALGNDTP